MKNSESINKCLLIVVLWIPVLIRCALRQALIINYKKLTMMIRSFKYHIAPAHSIENDIQDDCQYIIISTGSCYDMLNEKKNVLVLHFADTELDVRLDSIHLNNVEMIDAFLQKCIFDDVFISCDEGQSRSPAVTAGLLKCSGNDDSYIWKSNEYRPNVLVYRTVLEYYSSLPNVANELKRIKGDTVEGYREFRKNE